MNVVFDLDGTLCFDGQTIAPIIREALHALIQNGHTVLFASARSYRDCLPVIGEDFANQYVIGLNGGVVYHQARVIYQTNIAGHGYQQLTAYCQQKGIPFFVDNVFDYASFQEEKMPFYPHVDPLKLAKKVAVRDLENPIKLVIYLGEHTEHLQALSTFVQEDATLSMMYHEGEHCFYVNAKDVHKASALQHVLQQPYICFGNDKNDLEMFRNAQYAIQIGDYEPLTPYANQQLKATQTLESDIAMTIRQLAQS
ncbi:MAG: HAD-IIB family hydrolase [Aerococcaceae bacterium]|nr:HAD-IIB family hydrolase [Aerococcaceae bacterium]